MYKKKQIFMLIMSLSCMLLVACGKKNKSDVVSHDFDAEYVFVPELLKNTTRLLSIKPPGNNIFPVVMK